MNSDDTSRSGVNKDNLPTGSQITNPDSNANLSLTTNESKGAIPKTRLPKITQKKTNNNVDDMSSLNNDVLKLNGFSKGSSATSNFLNNTFIDCEAVNVQVHSAKDAHKTQTGFEKGSLNIPVENDFLNGAYMPLNNCTSEFVDLCEAGTSYREQDIKESDSSSDDNELLSLSDDGCIYTYKGDHVADLPSSFYNLEIPPLDEIPGDGREGMYFLPYFIDFVIIAILNLSNNLLNKLNSDLLGHWIMKLNADYIFFGADFIEEKIIVDTILFTCVILKTIVFMQIAMNFFFKCM